MGPIGTARDPTGLRRILAVVDLLHDAASESSLLPALLPALLQALPADSVLYTLPGPHGPVVHTHPPGVLDAAAAAALERHSTTDPLLVHTRTGPGTPIRRSDLQTRAEFRALGSYAEVARGLDSDHQLAMAFATGPDRSACVAFNRSRVDFTDAHLVVADVLRPRLATAITRLAASAVPSALTARETEIVELLSRGHTNQQIAHRLGISPRTVEKHLERAYGKLHAHGTTRVQLAARWQNATHDPEGPLAPHGGVTGSV